MAEDAVVTALDGSAAFLMMDDILERLKMLDYELAFRGFTRLTHTYFAMPAPNPNEQFHYFMALCSWLMGLLGSAWQAPSQSDDPNLAAQSLHSQLQQIPIEFKPALHAEEAEYEDAAVAEDEADGAHDMADEVGDAENEEEEYYHGGGDEAGPSAGRQGKLTDNILEAQVEPEAWRVELERVAPQLKMQVLSDPKEWRNRLVNTKSHQAKLQALAPETAATLERLAEDLARTLQAIQNAEQKVNTQCADAVARYAERKDELRARMEEYNKNADTINALTSDLQSVSEDLAKVKAQMDTRGASMTDTKPLLKVKTALTQLRTETKQLEIRIGVLTSTLTSKKLKEASIPRNSEVSKRGADCEAFLDDDDMEQL